MFENLKYTGNNKQWLEKELQKQKVGNIQDVFLAECDADNVLYIYRKTEDAPKNDPFQ